jgi:hypothetical protein
MSQTYPFPVSNDEFAGKRALVTGGTKGVGQAIARRCPPHRVSNVGTFSTSAPRPSAVPRFTSGRSTR